MLSVCDNFLYYFKGALTRATGQQARRSNLDKVTLAAAHIGLVWAGQRPPDRRTAYGPPSLVKAAALFAREYQKPDVIRARGSGGTLTTRATASAGE